MEKILIVEDDEVIRTIIKECLSKRFDLDEAADGSIAMRMILEIEYDLIITDITMPKLTGTILAAVINDYKPSLPFIILSNISSNYKQYVSHFPNVKIWIEKPFNPITLIGMVDGIFGGHLD